MVDDPSMLSRRVYLFRIRSAIGLLPLFLVEEMADFGHIHSRPLHFSLGMFES